MEKDQIQNADIVNLNEYKPVSDICASLDTVVPASMRFELHRAMETIDRRVNDIDEFVARKLGYISGTASTEERKAGLKFLCDAFGAEQVDGIATAIYNIEYKNQGVIIGDQTGIGKGRQAAAIIRYGMRIGLQPIFLTEKPNLFSDILRDLIAIGSDDGVILKYLEGSQEEERDDEDMEDEDQEELEEMGEEFEGTEDDETEVNSKFTKREVYRKNAQYQEQSKGKRRVNPFIVNADGPKTKVKDEDGNIIYEPDNAVSKLAFQTAKIPTGYGCVFATYSQFRGGKKGSVKMDFLRQIAQNNIVILDESHNASGKSNTGEFLMGVLAETKGVVFLSATFAKRPDNMPIYATKTAMMDANMTTDGLITAIQNGGVALQEIISAQLTGEGQYLRRQRSYEGIDVNYIYLDESQDLLGRGYLNKSLEHRAIYDKATDIMRDIIFFQKEFVDPIVDDLDAEMAQQQSSAGVSKGVREGGISNPPAFSGVFNVINQLLFAIKAESVAQVTIDRLKQGKSVIVAFGNTMESFLDDLEDEKGRPASYGDIINGDFSMVLMRRLKGVLRYTVKKAGKKKGEVKTIDPRTQSPQFLEAYKRIVDKIQQASIGIGCSPIDTVIDKIEEAGYTVAEVTGRKSRVKTMDNGSARLMRRDKMNATDAFRRFNDNEVDVLLINRSGSTGASAQAIPTKKVPANKVKQRCMVILQAELDINTEVQKRGRINRTGQIKKPIYDYVISAVPAEQRLMMMLQKKLKSLDANTASNQKESKKLLDTDDFLNKYGDDIAVEYLKENPAVNLMIDDPLRLTKEKKGGKEEGEEKIDSTNAAHRVAGRIGIMPIEIQEDFYREMLSRYEADVLLKVQEGTYDLEVEDLDLQAEVIEKQIIVAGKPDAKSVFGRNTMLEKCSVNNLKKPLSSKELDVILKENLGGKTAEELREMMLTNMKTYITDAGNEEFQLIRESYATQIEKIKREKAYTSLETDEEKEDYYDERKLAIEMRRDDQLQKARKSFNNRYELLRDLMNFFYVGRVIGYPSATYKTDAAYYRGVCLGFDIKKDSKSPYTPSNMKIKFAIANGLKVVAVPASKFEILDAVQKITYSKISSYEDETIISRWDDLCRESTGDKEIRYIMTGNILQGLGNANLTGKLVSYTTIDNKIKKGVLLPFGFNPTQQAGGLKISIPIIKALPLIKALPDEKQISTTDNLTFVKRRWVDAFNIIVPAVKKTGGKYYLDNFITSLMVNQEFNKSGANMVATLDIKNLDRLVEYLQSKFQASVKVSKQQLDYSGLAEEMAEQDEMLGELVVDELSKPRREDDERLAGEDVEDEETANLYSSLAEAEKRAGLNNLYRKLVVTAIKQGASPSMF